ncbi:MAG: adenylyltransferase/cytidyltransferase family protein, partial [Verrucomicrobia bacterium]|nr:adenylyltransferase/cytidyltransferase family protein [Verrucomicrobiota bacterium]
MHAGVCPQSRLNCVYEIAYERFHSRCDLTTKSNRAGYTGSGQPRPSTKYSLSLRTIDASDEVLSLISYWDVVNGKIFGRQALLSWVERQRSIGHTVGFTCGAFDLLHAGHVQYLAESRQYCDRLVVAVNSDAS